MKHIFMAVIAASVCATSLAQPRYDMDNIQRERLDRGVVAIRQDAGHVVVSWRTLYSDKKGEPVITVSNDSFAVSFRRADGFITRYDYQGRPLLGEGGMLRPNFWRAVTEGAPELPAEVPTGAQPIEYAFQAVCRALARNERFTALIALNDELAQGALAAFNENGIRVPEQISLVSIGDTPFCRYSVPPITALNPNLAEHVRQGFELLARNRLRPGAPELLRLVVPSLVIRRSDCALSPFFSVQLKSRETKAL